MTSSQESSAITVLGVGNPIMGDDGVGLELLAGVQERCGDLRVEFVDGGTGGMELLPVVQDTSSLLILDAVAGSVPGEVKVLVGDQISRMLASKLSPHQVSLLDVFAAARLLGSEPSTVVVVGVVPESVDVRLGLSEVVTAAVPAAVDRAVSVLSGWLAESSDPAASAECRIMHTSTGVSRPEPVHNPTLVGLGAAGRGGAGGGPLDARQALDGDPSCGDSPCGVA